MKSHKFSTPWRLQGGGWNSDDEINVHSEGAEFDELVVGQWFHIERMDKRHWWMRVGDVHFDIEVRPGQTPSAVISHRRLGKLEGTE